MVNIPGNVKQITKMAQMIYVANFAIWFAGKNCHFKGDIAMFRRMGCGLREQQESNIVGEDLEVTLGMTREDLGLMPEEDGASVYGNITLQDDDVEINALKAGKSGYTISPTIDEVKFLDHDVERVIAVETMGMFHRMVQEDAYKNLTLIVGLY